MNQMWRCYALALLVVGVLGAIQRGDARRLLAAPQCPTCVSMHKGSGVTADGCQDFAAAVQRYYSQLPGARPGAPFVCTSFEAGTGVATACNADAKGRDAASLVALLRADNAAYSLEQELSLRCVNYGPAAGQYQDYLQVTNACAASSPASLATFFASCVDPAAVAFPFASCRHAAGAAPFSFEQHVTKSQLAGSVNGRDADLYNLTLTVDPGRAVSDSISIFVATKVEFWLKESMRSSLLGAYIGGVFLVPSWGSGSSGEPEAHMNKVHFSFPGSGFEASAAGGTVFSLVVSRDSSLASLSAAAHRPEQMYYAIFSGDGRYCPLGYVLSPPE